MSRSEFMSQIVKTYKENDANFAETAIEMTDKYFDSLPESKSKIDPNRLGPKSTFLSQLRTALMEAVGPLEVDGKNAFNKMTVKEQLKFQAQSRAMNTSGWVHSLEIIPPNIADIKSSNDEINLLKTNRAKIDMGKLRDEMLEFEGDRLLEKLMPALHGDKRHRMAAGLLLATGRRTVEVLKTGNFYLNKNQSSKGYVCMFSGQAKEGLFPGGEYEIPLLAPYWLVKKAFTQVREMYPTDGFTNADVNSSYAPSINAYLKKSCGLTPHSLRAAYAIMNYALSGKDEMGKNKKRISLIGYISRILGHSQPSAAAYYQRMSVVDLSGPFQAEYQEPIKEVIADEENSIWNVSGKVEQKRLAGVLEMMERGIRVTSTSIREHAGGSMAVIQRFILKNQEVIKRYNESLEED